MPARSFESTSSSGARLRVSDCLDARYRAGEANGEKEAARDD